MTVTSNDSDWSFKVLFIGDSSVGKTSLMFRFSENIFDENLKPTIGIDFKIKRIDFNGQKVKFQFWDTAGQEKFFNITRSYYRNADAIILVYDRTEASSFQSIARWMKNIDENASENVLRILVGNKTDLEQRLVVSTNDGEALAAKYRVDFYETSAKLDQTANLGKIFDNLATKLITIRTNSVREENQTKSIQLIENKSSNVYSCCST